jgi:hypothetical protein
VSYSRQTMVHGQPDCLSIADTGGVRHVLGSIVGGIISSDAINDTTGQVCHVNS